MSVIFRLCRAAVLCALVLSARSAGAQEFKTTPAKEVATNPQRFWARGVVFRDQLVETVGKDRMKVGERRAYRFTTKVVGDCYADEKIVEVMRGLEPGRDYIFTASVFSEKKGFFSRKTVYIVLVDGIVVPAKDVRSISEELDEALAQRAAKNPMLQQIDILKKLIVNVQESLTAMAATEQIDRAVYFDPESEQFDKFIQATRRVVSDFETESKIPGREEFVQILAALIALKEGALVEKQPEPVPAAATNEPSAVTAPDAAATNEPPPVIQPAEEKPAEPPAKEQQPKRKKRFWQKKEKEQTEEVAPELRWQIQSTNEPAPAATNEAAAVMQEPATGTTPEPAMEMPAEPTDSTSLETPETEIAPDLEPQDMAAPESTGEIPLEPIETPAP